MENENQYFFDTVKGRTIDLVVMRDGVQSAHYSKHTIDTLKAQYPGLIIVSETEAVQRERAIFIKTPFPSDEATFSDALNCMPPSRWTYHPSSESFHICERIAHDIVSWFVRIGKDYYRFDDTCYLTHAQVVEKVVEWLKTLPHTEAVQSCPEHAMA